VTAVVLLAHGSRDPRSSDAVRSFVEMLPERGVHYSVHAAFLDHNRPTLQEVVDALPHHERHVVVVPMLLSAAFHAKSDVPAAISGLSTTRSVVTTAPVGSISTLATAAAAELEGPIVLAFSGTSDPLAQADLQALASDLAAARGAAVTVGYVTQAEPDVSTAIATSGATGVLTYTLWPGMFTDRVRIASEEAGLPCSKALWQHDALPDAVIALVESALH
jgi:sirohydrochlorin ferrochelatase